jgi:hypothetical protein
MHFTSAVALLAITCYFLFERRRQQQRCNTSSVKYTQTSSRRWHYNNNCLLSFPEFLLVASSSPPRWFYVKRACPYLPATARFSNTPDYDGCCKYVVFRVVFFFFFYSFLRETSRGRAVYRTVYISTHRRVLTRTQYNRRTYVSLRIYQHFTTGIPICHGSFCACVVNPTDESVDHPFRNSVQNKIKN